jgi:dynein heavy chain 2
MILYCGCLIRRYCTQFRPPLEEVRAKYYREMKKFICIPERFNGIGESGK